ncbi:MAG TPA: tetratricopeptide repeat protein, partial [Spirochaetales bacterium]|nr:tetratricopeptide repeat protein [Spirochaetales bacterium]
TRIKKKKLDKPQILKEANRRLAQNPNDVEALFMLAELYFDEQEWEKALKLYENLNRLGETNSEIDVFEVSKRIGLCCYRLGKNDDAYKAFTIAKTGKPDDFEINYNLGVLEYMKKNYEKALPLLKQAYAANNEHIMSLRFLGLCLFKVKQYREALSIIKKVLEQQPDDKESLFAMGECFYENNQMDQALRILSHLRVDPDFGPAAALFSGTIYMNQRQYKKAIVDFEIGLKHKTIAPEILVELKYRMAVAYLQESEISRAVQLLHEVMQIAPGYKDVEALYNRYKELNSNHNLQVYLLSPVSEFINLCKKIITYLYSGAKIKINDIYAQQSEFVDIFIEVETPKWADFVLIRFIRSSGVTGEFLVRDLNTRMKDMKAGRGLCISAGQFSEEAQKFVEVRLIDLYSKDKLMKILTSIDTKIRGTLAD